MPNRIQENGVAEQRKVLELNFRDAQIERVGRGTDVAALPSRRAKKERKPSRTGVETRNKLVDAAEQMFADHGYEGTSLRDITEQAGVHIALASYHFGTKERLFDEVIRRRAKEMEEIRLAGLGRIDPAAQSVSESVRLMIEAYALPMIHARYGKSRQWQAHVRLMARLYNVKRWTPLVRKHYDRTAHAYIDRWRELLPNAASDSLFNAFSFMVATMLYVCSYPDRFGTWKEKSVARRLKIQRATEDLVRFVHAGFMDLAEKASS